MRGSETLTKLAYAGGFVSSSIKSAKDPILIELRKFMELVTAETPAKNVSRPTRTE